MHVQVHGNLVVIHAFVLINASLVGEILKLLVQTTKLLVQTSVLITCANYEINSTTHRLPWLERF